MKLYIVYEWKRRKRGGGYDVFSFESMIWVGKREMGVGEGRAFLFDK